MANRKKFGIKYISALLILTTFTAAFFGCGAKYDENEIKAAAVALIEESYKINEICFGDGLPADFSSTENGGEYVEGSLVYAYVDEMCPYHSTAELKDAISETYSSAYSEYLCTLLFTGLSVSVGGGEDDSDKQNVAYARYMDGDEGLEALLMDPDDIMSLERTYDTENITVVSQKNGRVEISVPSYLKGERDIDVTLTLVLENGEWRLDTPTY